MKRIISITIAIVFLLSCMCFAYGQDTNSDKAPVYDDYGNVYYISPDEVLGVITDSKGNIVSVSTTRAIYVPGTVYTIPAGGSFNTYQYSPSDYFAAGFYFVKGYSQVTDSGKSVTISIKNAATIGGGRSIVLTHSFSTTESNNIGSGYYFSGVGGGSGVELVASPISSTRSYYNAEYKNNSGSPLKISILVAMD